jgi:hypothetical protein
MIGDLDVFGEVLAGAEVHAAEDLARVGGDDFTAKMLRSGYPQPGFAGGGGAENDQQVV